MSECCRRIECLSVISDAMVTGLSVFAAGAGVDNPVTGIGMDTDRFVSAYGFDGGVHASAVLATPSADAASESACSSPKVCAGLLADRCPTVTAWAGAVFPKTDSVRLCLSPMVTAVGPPGFTGVATEAMTDEADILARRICQLSIILVTEFILDKTQLDNDKYMLG